MGQPYVGEIRMFGGNFAPAGWMFCNGQILPISENETLFQLIGTTYGGDGQSTFALPDLQGRVPVHQGTFGGTTFIQGEKSGTETVTLTGNQIPTHNHLLTGSGNLGTSNTPQNNVLAQSSAVKLYLNLPPDINLGNQAITPVGGSQPHDNMQPFLCVSFIISLFGVFPSQN
jgi:microcystin-dependent protein